MPFKHVYQLEIPSHLHLDTIYVSRLVCVCRVKTLKPIIKLILVFMYVVL